MLWVTVTYVVENILPMLSTTCTPQHIPCSPHYVVHFILCLCCGCMMWTTLSYVVDDMFADVVHNIYMFSTTYDMLWSTCVVFHYVPHNIHPQYIKLSTTYTHNICPLICCGCMLWITITICCGVHMLWSTRTFTDDQAGISDTTKLEIKLAQQAGD